MFNKCLIQEWEISYIAGTNEFDITLCQLDCANGAYLYFEISYIAGTNEFDITLCQLDCANEAYLYFESRSYKQAPFISKMQVSKHKDIHQ